MLFKTLLINFLVCCFATSYSQTAEELLSQAQSGRASTTEQLKLLHRAIALDPSNPASYVSLTKLLEDRPAFYTRLYDMNGPVQAVAFAPDGRHVLLAGNDYTAVLWSLEGKKLQIFRGHADIISCLAFSPDGQFIVTGSDDMTVKLWTVSGELVRSFSGHQMGVTEVAFSPDGRYILSGSKDGTAKMWGVSGELLHTFPTGELTGFGHLEVVAVSFSPDQQYVLVGITGGEILLWTMAGKPVKHFKALSPTIGAKFSADSKQIISLHYNGKILIWNIDGSESYLDLTEDDSGMEAGMLYDVLGEIASFDSHEQLATLPTQQTSRVYKRRKVYEKGMLSMDVSPVGDYVGMGLHDGSSKIYTLSGTAQAHLNSGYKGRGGRAAVQTVAFSPDGKYVLTGNNDGTAALWPVTMPSRMLDKQTPGGYRIGSLDMTADGQYVLMASGDYGQALCWDREGKLIVDLGYAGRDRRISQARFSPDGKYILSTVGRNKARIWKPDSSVVATLEGHTGHIRRIAFSPDGTAVLSAGDDTTIRIWNLAGVETSRIPHLNDGLFDLQVSADNKQMLLGLSDSTAQLLDKNGKLKHVLHGHQSVVSVVAFSPDGKTIATGSADKTIKLWTAKGALLKTLYGHANYITSLRFSPDGQYLLSTANDDAPILWDKDGNLLWVYPELLGASMGIFLEGTRRIGLIKSVSGFSTYVLAADYPYDFLPLNELTAKEKATFGVED